MNKKPLTRPTLVALILVLALLPGIGPLLQAAENAVGNAAGNAADEALEKIHIQADHMQLNTVTGNSVYTGNVRIRQGDLLLTGDRVSIEQGKDAVERITVTGRPAHYNHVTRTGDNIQATSEHMVYTASEHKLVMTINARLKQPDHEVSSEKIIYDTEKKLVIAGSKSDSTDGGFGEDEADDEKQRVKIILTPRKQPAGQKAGP